MKPLSRTRTVGVGAAWLAACALLLNALLTSAALAAVPPIDQLGRLVICHAGDPSAAPSEPASAIDASAAHCKLCVPGLAAAPPPSPAEAAFHRVAIAERFDPASDTSLESVAPTASYESRGPPRLS